MRTWTIEEMLAEEPCVRYDRALLESLWAGREHLTLLEGLDLDIPDVDKIWWACRHNAFPGQAQWIEGIVERAVRTHALHCGLEAVETWAARWLSGKDRTEAAAEAAAGAAAGAALAAARAAAGAALAAAGATWDAARDAARAAERARQVQDLRAILEAA